MFSAKKKLTSHNSGRYKALYSLVVTADCLTLSLEFECEGHCDVCCCEMTYVDSMGPLPVSASFC